MPLDIFINEKFLPGRASNRPQQPASQAVDRAVEISGWS